MSLPLGRVVPRTTKRLLEYDHAIFATILGGPDRKTLFLLATEWRGTEQVNEAVAARTGQVLASQAPEAVAGWP